MTDSDWSKTFPVLTLSRLYLRDVCRFPSEIINNLTDVDMYAITDLLHDYYVDQFDENVQFCVMIRLLQKIREHDDKTS